MSKATHESVVVSYSPLDSIDARMEIFSLMNNYSATDEEKERSLNNLLSNSREEISNLRNEKQKLTEKYNLINLLLKTFLIIN